MGFIRSILEHHRKEKRIKTELCTALITKINTALEDLNIIFENKEVFIEPQQEIILKEQNSDLLINTSTDNITKLKKANNFKELSNKAYELSKVINTLKQQISTHNEKVANTKIKTAYNLIGNVEGRQLDKQQMLCIVKDVHNHLVIAGAGTGKTTTVIGKIKYLLKTEKCLPNDILVLSFTNASATEMSKRIYNETGYDISASTFHKLGLNIITEVNKIVPKITQLNLQKFIKEQLDINIQSDSYLKLFNSYLLFNRISAKSEFDFKTQSEYEEYLKQNPPITLKYEEVKSYGELDIANFLASNGINYIYENAYKFDTRTSKYGQYYPDFYLPDYDIYIEYFGINKNGEVPAYFKSTNGTSPTLHYHEAIKWKREIHKINNTTMIECFAYEKFDDTLLENLKNNLVKNNVKLTPKSPKELWRQILSGNENTLDGIIELFETIINLIKSNDYTINYVKQLNSKSCNEKSNAVILELIEPIFNSYCNYLTEHQEIDFNDMINLAKKYVDIGRYHNKYKYVIVDEYQDISKARFSLLNSLRKSRDYNLFCVGDDWQSIYRFAGSDIGYTLNFEHHWGLSEISKIETTYRFSQKLIEISGNFIMQNPAQIKKSIKGKNDTTNFPMGEIMGYTEKYAIIFMTKRLDDLPQNSTVFFIGRYSFDIKILNDNELFNCAYNTAGGIINITYKNRKDLKINFITAHKSKGLQADYVFIINNKKTKMGFPSKIQDTPIFNLLLDNYDQYPYAEERRLFYVAMTRAKEKVFLVTIKDQESDFIIELKKYYSDELKREQFECPLCGGKLFKKSNSQNDGFLYCSNFKKLGCTYKRKLGLSK